MAFASSRIGAQEAIIKPCDLCEDEEDVNWFCKNCLQNLCDRCKKMHPKIVTFRDHQLVPMLEGVSIMKENVTNQCEEHNEPFSFYCKRCEQNICSKCLSLIHKKHDFIDIRQFHSELQDKLQRVLEQKENENEQIERNLSAFAKYEDECEKTLMENFTIIDERREAIRESLDEECEEMKKRMKATTEQQLLNKKEKEREVKERQNAYDETIKRVKQQVQLQTSATINKFVQASIRDLQSLEPISYPVPRMSTFKVGIINEANLCNLIGKYVDINEENVRNGGNVFLPQLDIVSVYDLEVEQQCRSICTCPDGSIWIAGVYYMYMMNSDCSAILHMIPTNRGDIVHPLICYGVACLPSGDAVMSFGGLRPYSDSLESYIDKFTSDGKRENLKRDLEKNRYHDEWTYDIAVTDQGGGIVSIGKISRLSRKTFLTIFSNEGIELKEFEVNKEIASFCIGVDGDFIISDKNSCYLTTIDWNGTILKETETVTPGLRRLICDRLENILGVSDDGKTVCLINKDGKVDRFFAVQCEYSIQDICIDRDDHLVILVDRRKIIVAKYLQ